MTINETDTPATVQKTPSEAADKPDLGMFGVWTTNPVSPEVAQEIEKLGYGAVWVSSAAPDDLSWVDPIFDSTTTLKAATGIINIWNSPSARVAEAYHRLEDLHPDGSCSASAQATAKPSPSGRSPSTR